MHLRTHVVDRSVDPHSNQFLPPLLRKSTKRKDQNLTQISPSRYIPTWLGCIISLLSVALAYLLQKKIWGSIPSLPFFLFYPTIFFSAWLGGKGCGVVATFLSVVIVDYNFLPPYGQFSFSGQNLTAEAIFMCLGITITILINRQKQSHEIAATSSTRLRNLVDWMDHAIIWEIDSETLACSFVSQGTERILNIPMEQWYRKPGLFLDIVHPDDRPKLMHLLANIIRGHNNQSIDHRIVHPNGEVQWYQTGIHSDHEGVGIKLRCITVDIGRVKKSEEALKQSEQRFDLALKAGKIGVFEMDLRIPNIPVKWTERQFEIYGVTPESDSLFYADFRAFVHPDDLPKVDQEFESSIHEKREFNLTFRVKLKNGNQRWIQGRARTFYDETGTPIRMIGTNIDVTEQIKTQEDITRALKSREEMLAIVSHDLRNPLGSILMNAAMLKRKTENDIRFVNTRADNIQKAGERMNELIEDLLNLAKMEAGTFALKRKTLLGFNILTEAVEMMTPLAQEKNIRIETTETDQNLRLHCDHNLILRVLLNLLGNAIKFTPEEGLIRISVKNRGNEIQFCISDTGPGIIEQHIPHVFDRFWQATKTQHMGTGLGLSISKGIIEAHSGKIWVESHFGHGASFYFTIPKPTQTSDKQAA